ncbi:MAG: PD-(D/E)XK nuclease family protein [Fibrobacter sp.]|uniref:PD-(D/E)XK nuclease family protein n=1 Tax=Fibrobacter sp. TaxID=35828 RepID=UPI0025C6BED6|nr:PD-(D/E)XK nuclease family protein [Fibrobacter sp.]MBQ9227041.1 PD-(D/E)XK nuclease family protein [Fibrobacter sp.]
MNIFKILSSYDGSIKEPNISSFLAYLLDLNEDHGLSDLLLMSIIQDFKDKNPLFFGKIKKTLNQFDVRINPEYPVFFDNKRRDIDIVVEIYEEKNEIPLYSLCIENKITDNSIQRKKQLIEELEGLKKEYKDNGWNTEIYFCFLTLENSKKSNDEFNVFDYEKKIHLYWKGELSIQEKILKILGLERNGEIDPISEDFKFLLKSFLSFVKTDFKSSVEEKSEKQERKNYGRTVMEFFRDFAKTMADGKDYKISEVKKAISTMIKKESGVSVNKGTLNCHICATIVNEKNRVHYQVTEKNCDYKNLFFYPNEKNKEVIRKYTPNIKNVKVYVK